MRRFDHNTDNIPLNIMSALTILAKDPHVLLKKKKLGPTADLREEGAGSGAGHGGRRRG